MSGTIIQTEPRVALAVIGSRSYTNEEELFQILDKKIDRIKYIVSGGAEGPDSFSQNWCKQRGVPCIIFYPKWYNKEGIFDRGAGMKRNILIIKNCDVCLAFWDGESKGTKNSIDLCQTYNKKLIIRKFQKTNA